MVSVDFPKSYENEAVSKNVDKAKIPKEVLVIAQEIKIVKALACNDLKLREKQLRKLRKWIKIRSNSSFEFTNEDFLRLWKGLYYCMWMSDKPLVQENLADELGQLIECFTNVNNKIHFFGAFLKTMSLEWFSIDQWRMDKFMMLVRRMLRYTLKALKKELWSIESINVFNDEIFSTVLESNVIGLSMHFIDIFLEELAKVSEGKLPAEKVASLLMSFVKFMAKQKDSNLLAHVKSAVFYQILWQSDRGREFTEKYNVWKDMGFPTSSIHDLEKIEKESDSEKEDELEELGSKKKLITDSFDPRAGNVDVLMPILPFDCDPIIKYIEKLMFKDITNTKSRKAMNEIVGKYKAYQNGKFPLGAKSVTKLKLEPKGPLVKKKMSALEILDEELYGTTRQLKKLNKKQRKKFLADINYENATEENVDSIIQNELKNENNKIISKKRKLSINQNWLEEDVVESPIKKIKKVSQKKPLQNNLENFSKISLKPPNDTEKLNKNVDEIKLKKFKSDWDEPLKNGEIEYFLPSPKIKVLEANDSLLKEKKSPGKLLLNPYAKKQIDSSKVHKNLLLGKSMKKVKSMQSIVNATQKTVGKKVKIVLTKNMAQKPSEYIRQVKNSPQLPYDSEKRPTKSLLKPNLMPSPINPFYKKKIGLNFNDTM